MSEDDAIEIRAKGAVKTAVQHIERGEEYAENDNFERAEIYFQKAIPLLEDAIDYEKKRDRDNGGKPLIYRPSYRRLQTLLKQTEEKHENITKKIEPDFPTRDSGETDKRGADGTTSDEPQSLTDKLSSLSPRQIRGLLQQIDEYRFEQLVADLWREQGWSTRVTKSSNDQGIDIVATKKDPYPVKLLIQAKRYAEGNNVGSQAVQLYSSLRQQEENVDLILLVTTSSFTQPAEQRAQELNVKLLDGYSLAEWISKNEMYDVLSSYVRIRK